MIYGGAVHLSKEAILNQTGLPNYGGICQLKDHRWSALYRNSFLSSISQEHGIIDADHELFATTDIGDLIVVIPVHSCLTANLFGEYLTFNGDTIKKFRY